MRYSQITRSLIYLVGATRPDILFAVNKLSRITSNLGDDHWCAVERVMYYLAGTIYYKIHYFGYPAVLDGYNDERLSPNLSRCRGKSIVEISTLITNALNRTSNLCSHYTTALLVINPCAHKLTSSRRLILQVQLRTQART
jgi:hypothetical protein